MKLGLLGEGTAYLKSDVLILTINLRVKNDEAFQKRYNTSLYHKVLRIFLAFKILK